MGVFKTVESFMKGSAIILLITIVGMILNWFYVEFGVILSITYFIWFVGSVNLVYRVIKMESLQSIYVGFMLFISSILAGTVFAGIMMIIGVLKL